MGLLFGGSTGGSISWWIVVVLVSLSPSLGVVDEMMDDDVVAAAVADDDIYRWSIHVNWYRYNNVWTNSGKVRILVFRVRWRWLFLKLLESEWSFGKDVDSVIGTSWWQCCENIFVGVSSLVWLGCSIPITISFTKTSLSFSFLTYSKCVGGGCSM